MNWGPIPNSDNLYRHSVFPPSFIGKGKTFSHEKLWKLFDRDNNTVVTSIAWERYVPAVNYIHAYGCRLASKRNEGNRSENKGKQRQVYCGAYQLKAHAIRGLKGTEGLDEVLSADIIHHVENDEIAHANLTITLSPETSDREGTKTAIMIRLWNMTHGPLKHICACDLEAADNHPSKSLPLGPAGEYYDTRSGFSRHWYHLRFVIHSWLWQHLYRK